MPLLRHLVFFKFSSAATPAKIAALKQAFNALPSQIPGISYYQLFDSYEPSIPSKYPALNQGYSVVIDSIFESHHALSLYAPHPAHQGAINNYLAPIKEDNLVVDYELPSSFDIAAFKKYQSSNEYLHRLVLVKPKGDSSNKEVIQETIGLQQQIPFIKYTISGTQDTNNMYQGYNDRSKGFKDVVEFYVSPISKREEYLANPHRLAALEKGKNASADVFIFEYVCGEHVQAQH